MAAKQTTDEPWQSGLTTVSKRISYLRASPKWTDLTIIFPQHKKCIKAHKLLLALSSPVFEAMMFGPLAVDNVLSLPDDPLDAFEWLLDHLYCDQRDFPNVEMATEVFKLAHKYQIQELCRICSEYLCQQVNANNFPLLYNIANIFEDNPLLKCCDKILPTKSDKVLQSKEISKISPSTLKHILENEKLKPSSSLTVFTCIHEWGKAELGRLAATRSNMEGQREAAGQTGKETDIAPLADNIRRCVESLLHLVDFPSLSVDEFARHVLPTGIFTPEENMMILQWLTNVPGIVLPSCLPWTLKHVVLVNKKVCIGARSFSGCFCKMTTTCRIIICQARVLFSECVPEGNLLISNAVKEVIGKGRLTQNCCTFAKPVGLKAGVEFSFLFSNNLSFSQIVPLHIESGDKNITGKAQDIVKKLEITCYVLDK